MEEGFVLSNKFRRAIFTEIGSGEHMILTISKKHHIPENIAKKTLEELIKAGLVKAEENRYTLTKNGEKIFEKLRNQQL